MNACASPMQRSFRNARRTRLHTLQQDRVNSKYQLCRAGGRERGVLEAARGTSARRAPGSFDALVDIRQEGAYRALVECRGERHEEASDRSVTGNARSAGAQDA